MKQPSEETQAYHRLPYNITLMYMYEIVILKKILKHLYRA